MITWQDVGFGWARSARQSSKRPTKANKPFHSNGNGHVYAATLSNFGKWVQKYRKEVVIPISLQFKRLKDVNEDAWT